MRWMLVAILAYVALVLETALFRPGGIAVPIDGHWARPDLVLMVGLFVALYFEPPEVFIAAWGLGLGADLVSVSGRLGVYAVLFCLALTAVSYVRRNLNRGWVLTQSVLCFVVAATTHFGWYLAARYLAGAPLGAARSLEQALLDAAFSAVVCPYVFWVLLRLRGPLGILVEPHEI